MCKVGATEFLPNTRYTIPMYTLFDFLTDKKYPDIHCISYKRHKSNAQVSMFYKSSVG